VQYNSDIFLPRSIHSTVYAMNIRLTVRTCVGNFYALRVSKRLNMLMSPYRFHAGRPFIPVL